MPTVATIRASCAGSPSRSRLGLPPFSLPRETGWARFAQQKKGETQADPFPRHVECGPAIASRAEDDRRRDHMSRDDEPEGRVEDGQANRPIAAAKPAPGPDGRRRKPQFDNPERLSLRRRLGRNEPTKNDQPQDENRRDLCEGIGRRVGGRRGGLSFWEKCPSRSRIGRRLAPGFAHAVSSTAVVRTVNVSRFRFVAARPFPGSPQWPACKPLMPRRGTRPTSRKCGTEAVPPVPSSASPGEP